MKKLFIIGAGGFGRELLQWVKDINKAEVAWDIQGFIDDDLNALDGVECDYSVVGKLSDCQPKEDEYYASVNSTVGKHVTIMSSGVGHDIKVGDYCTLCGNVTVIRNVVIGDRTYIASNVALNADVHVGNDCYIGMGSMVVKDIPDNSKTFCNPARILPQ